MPTINQLVRKRGRRKSPRKLDRVLQGRPQRRGVVTKIFVEKPRKPNSGDRKLARVKFSEGVEVTALIPGHGMGGLQQHGQVLVVRGRIPDVPGVNYKIVRGTLDLGDEGIGRGTKSTLDSRRNARSKYGAKRPRQ